LALDNRPNLLKPFYRVALLNTKNALIIVEGASFALNTNTKGKPTMYYKALVDINSSNTKIFKGKLKSDSKLQDIEKDIELKASKKSEVFTLAIVELITANSKTEFLNKCERL
tara:strand:- start:211 stop:549 length:339 start_codon:yes stop_codon:yes gene_type:complete